MILTPSHAHPRFRPMARSATRTTCRTAWILAASLLLGPGPGDAQPSKPIVVRPGDGQVDGRRIPAYESGWRSYRIASDGQRTPLTVWHDTVSIVDGDHGSVLRRVQRVVPQEGPVTVLLNEADRETLLLNEADRETLLHIRTTARRGDDEPFIDLRFEGRRLTGRRPFLPPERRAGRERFGTGGDGVCGAAV